MSKTDTTVDNRLRLKWLEQQAKKLRLENGGGNGHDGGMFTDDGRLGKLENEVHAIKGALDWAKIAFSILLGVVAVIAGLVWQVSGKVDGLSSKLTDEFRAQRAEMAAQTSAIANSITATKQQVPPVIVIPPQGSLTPNKQ